MGNIWLVLQREYFTRVRKKSFIIMTLLGPLLFAAVWVVPIVLALKSSSVKKIVVVDESRRFIDKFKDSKDLKFNYPENLSADAAKALLNSDGSDIYAVLHIPDINIDKPDGIKLFAGSNPSVDIEMSIERRIEDIIEEEKTRRAGVSPETLAQLKSNVKLTSRVLNKEGDEKESSSVASTAVGFMAGFLIYMFIFIYGSQIMKGVIEEKSNRIVEVIISSVRPFQLMMGKILGVALVGLTQFILWILLSMLITSAGTAIMAGTMQDKVSSAAVTEAAMQNQSDEVKAEVAKANPMEKVSKALGTINFPLVIAAFLFYFVGGYFFYGSLFAAIGAASDNETDTQQFMLPITVPLVLALVLAQFVIKDPTSQLAFWMSMIPFTSPIGMMIRLPFGVPAWELILSIILLVLGFIGTTWLAARIYRVGILMYGKKVNYKTLSKWLFYKA